MNISSFFNGYYDPQSDEIKNCEEGSLVWHHENRHKQQFNNKAVNTVSNFFHTLLIGAGSGLGLCFFILGLLNRVALDNILAGVFVVIGFVAFPYIAFQMLLEVDASIYQLKMAYKKHVRGN